MTREIGFVNVKTISGYRKSNELFNHGQRERVRNGLILFQRQLIYSSRAILLQYAFKIIEVMSHETMVKVAKTQSTF